MTTTNNTNVDPNNGAASGAGNSPVNAATPLAPVILHYINELSSRSEAIGEDHKFLYDLNAALEVVQKKDELSALKQEVENLHKCLATDRTSTEGLITSLGTKVTEGTTLHSNIQGKINEFNTLIAEEKKKITEESLYTDALARLINDTKSKHADSREQNDRMLVDGYIDKARTELDVCTTNRDKVIFAAFIGVPILAASFGYLKLPTHLIISISILLVIFASLALLALSKQAYALRSRIQDLENKRYSMP